MKKNSSKRSPRRLIALVALAVGLLMAAPAAANALTVYAASSLREAFPKMAPANTYNFSGSNELQLQIEHGAPADVFASAAPEEAQALFREGLCTRPVTFATNTVVLLVPNGNPGNIKSVYNLRGGGRTLDQQREQDGAWDIALGILRFLTPLDATGSPKESFLSAFRQGVYSVTEFRQGKSLPE